MPTKKTVCTLRIYDCTITILHILGQDDYCVYMNDDTQSGWGFMVASADTEKEAKEFAQRLEKFLKS